MCVGHKSYDNVSHRVTKPLFALCLTAVLVACGSGKGITPVAGSGFATAKDSIGSETKFTLQDVRLFLQTDETGALTAQDVTIDIDADGQPKVTVDGVAYRLEQEDSGIYSAVVDDTKVLYLRESQTDPNVVETIYLSFETENTFNAGFVAFGFDSAPGAVQRQSGSASLSGPAIISARQTIEGELQSGFSDGTAEIVADFDADTVTGTMRFDKPQDRPLELGDVTLTLQESAIRGNRFGGGLTVTSGSFGGDRVLQDGAYDARFYGAEAQAVGGTFTGSLQTNQPTGPIHLQGAFVAE